MEYARRKLHLLFERLPETLVTEVLGAFGTHGGVVHDLLALFAPH